MTTPLLKVTDLAVTYNSAHGPVHAVTDVSFSVAPGRVTAIVGESGSGKSTSAMATMGLLPANAAASGKIELNGQDLNRITQQQWRGVRGLKIGLIPQDPGTSLNPVKTIGESVGEVLRIHRQALGNPSKQERRATVIELLDAVGIDNPELRYDQYPHELSGGMRQRALIAAALATEPDLIIADEPTSALDVTVQQTILDLIDQLREDRGIGVLLITHDLAVASDRADELVVMQSGQVKEAGLTGRILGDPRHPYTRRLLDDAPGLTNPVRQPERARKHKAASAPAADAPGGEVNPEEKTPATPAARDSEESTPPLLRVSSMSKQFQPARGQEAFTAVDGVSFSVARGTTHAIVGQSGSGKSTLARMICAFEEPSTGAAYLEGAAINDLAAKDPRQLRRRLQMVYQNPYGSLDPRQSIGSAIAEPLRNLSSLTRTQIRAKVTEVLDQVSLPEALANRRAGELSGGQRQRVAIARALVLEPELLVLDEAVSALDVTVQARILELLNELQEELDLTYLFISHDLAVVREISDTVSVMSKGRQVELGFTEEIFYDPEHEFTRELLRAIPGQRYREGVFNLGL
ncbi:dipeptide ABC transporter ATP-binding protein [Corynebacterium urealyticum]|uniref:ABC transport system, ATP-binding protein n=1 Tax=Corynebacterium urealyticum (strain ATCC 43042 / DSM 7109) TaxID=504474 RepID=B1VEL9_CORU7|nr:ABC transporter ATP-binding protein [Corynebacterium urealyticum]QQC42263.1 ABC transporter ATP-binding protein [Corynebacterium urealyticum]CAQ04208.1 ABC transport system, ATP-binding protein [Corynebacterium urealyticum DSM 7109]SNV94061.1 ABC transporter ATP-binding protein [Corynebacterium urealyticum]